MLNVVLSAEGPILSWKMLPRCYVVKVTVDPRKMGILINWTKVN